MAQRRLTWSELRVGLFVLGALVILAMGIFYVTGAQGFWVSKIRYRAYLPEVEQLQDWAPVSLDVVVVSNVETIIMTPHPPDKQHNVTVVMRIERKYHNQ